MQCCAIRDPVMYAARTFWPRQANPSQPPMGLKISQGNMVYGRPTDPGLASCRGIGRIPARDVGSACDWASILSAITQSIREGDSNEKQVNPFLSSPAPEAFVCATRL
jgi:hypothetical protein